MPWKRMAVLLRRRIHYRIARGGVLFTLALLIVGAAAAVSANNLLFLIVAAMLATLLVSGLVSRLVLAGLELDLLLPEHISARSKTQAILRLRNLKHWMPSFSIQVAGWGSEPILKTPLYFPVLPGAQTFDEKVEVEFPRRGEHTEDLFVFSTRFPFGFLEKTATVTLRRETLVYPSIEPQPGFERLLSGIRGDLNTQLRGMGTDFYRIRPYELSESARYVDWKSTAHTGNLQVREFTREQQSQVEIFLDREESIPEFDPEWFEKAVECCAFLAWELTSQEITLLFRSQGFDMRFPDEGDLYTILRFLALVQPQRNLGGYSSSDDSSFQILLSASPERFLAEGWTPACVVGLHAFDGTAANPAPG